jgi:hypothetical protein
MNNQDLIYDSKRSQVTFIIIFIDKAIQNHYMQLFQSGKFRKYFGFSFCQRIEFLKFLHKLRDSSHITLIL